MLLVVVDFSSVSFFFFFNDTATTEIYPLSLHDALPIEEAKANAEEVDVSELPVPAFTGTRVVEPDLPSLVRFIDWQFFFHAWELKGKFPAILDQPAARELFDDAQAMLTQIVEGELLHAKGAYGFWPASSDGDDILLEDGTRLAMLRQQSAYGD